MKLEKLIPNNPIDWVEDITKECNQYPIHLIEIDKPFIVVDAGANVGGFVRAWGNKFNKIYSFEASRSNYEEMLKNTTSFDSKHERFHLAVGKEDNTVLKLMMYTHEDGKDTNSGNYGVVNYVNEKNNHGWKESTGYEEVKSISLESILKIVGGSIDLLKVDVEGSEFDFLFDKDLSAINYITMELHNFLYHGGRQRRLIEHILKTHEEIYSYGDGISMHFIKMWKRK
jgi:FkbM family methyltransferase